MIKSPYYTHYRSNVFYLFYNYCIILSITIFPPSIWKWMLYEDNQTSFRKLQLFSCTLAETSSIIDLDFFMHYCALVWADHTSIPSTLLLFLNGCAMCINYAFIRYTPNLQCYPKSTFKTDGLFGLQNTEVVLVWSDAKI